MIDVVKDWAFFWIFNVFIDMIVEYVEFVELECKVFEISVLKFDLELDVDYY